MYSTRLWFINCLKIYREEQVNEAVETVVNNFESPRRSSRKIKLTTTNEDMSYENMPRLQTQHFERRVSTDILNDQANENNQSVHTPILPAYKVKII